MLTMPSNKDRLYVALHARSTPNTYHWAFLVCPKNESDPSAQKPWRYHAKNSVQRDTEGKAPWVFEQQELVELQSHMLLVRLLIAKLQRSRRELERSLERVPILQNDPTWNCQAWIRNAFGQLDKDGILATRVPYGWDEIENACIAYVNKKKEEGRFSKSHLPLAVPTKDLIEDREIVA